MTAETPETITAADATCTLYRSAPAWGERKTAAIGGFACGSAQAGAALLKSVTKRLRAEGFQGAIGPMDGDTWHKYRVVSESDGSAPFFLEPVSGPHDFAAFDGAGFTAISSYVSARAPLDDATEVSAPPVPGITLRAWDGRDGANLFGRLFELSGNAFAGNAFYKPITREAFLALYEPILPAIDPRLVLFALDETGDLAGYLFAVPDRLEGAGCKTGIIKTYASRRPGVGRMLVDETNRTLRQLGFAHVIHALMHVDNKSRQRSALNQGKVFRRYDLMGLDLAAEA